MAFNTIGTTAADSTGNRSFQPTTPMSGKYVLYASVSGAYGSNTSSPLTVIIDPSVPSAPTVSAHASAPGAVTVDWTAATDAVPNQIAGYLVTESPGGNTWWVSAGQGKRQVFSGLPPGATYSFTIAAYNQQRVPRLQEHR